MMKYGKAFVIKILRFALNLFLFVGIVFNEPFRVALTLVLVLAPVTFLLGDMLILPKLGNVGAVLLDAPLIFGGILALHVMLGVHLTYGHFFLFSLITVALCIEEFMYHNYIERKVFGKDIPSLSEMINNL
ncbi:YndM family protein [Fodinisporobacter ferrooxydans]|uniref:YndM family protein n=1 Tax=Fodinisporobacter ferrooxydans TaxID=2901836 RepID=A0ABY4CPV7_9BACL|nr:YndM family protein [Alicyclobacillaceae bacterium MYW30-H2]